MSTARKKPAKKPSTKPPVSVGEVELDIDSLTLGEVEDFEAELGFPVDQVGIRPKGKALRVLLWLVLRRDDPDVDLEALRDVNFLAAGEQLGEGSESDA